MNRPQYWKSIAIAHISESYGDAQLLDRAITFRDNLEKSEDHRHSIVDCLIHNMLEYHYLMHRLEFNEN